MKKLIILGILLVINIVVMSGCSKGGELVSSIKNSNMSVEDKTFEKLMEHVKNKDNVSIKEMFSQSTVNNAENLDTEIQSLIDFSNGEVISYDDWGGANESDEIENGEKTLELRSTFDFSTTSGKYRITIKEVTIDTSEPDNIGIISVYITTPENTDEEFAYWGDGLWTPGINVLE